MMPEEEEDEWHEDWDKHEDGDKHEDWDKYEDSDKHEDGDKHEDWDKHEDGDKHEDWDKHEDGDKHDDGDKKDDDYYGGLGMSNMGEWGEIISCCFITLPMAPERVSFGSQKPFFHVKSLFLYGS